MKVLVINAGSSSLKYQVIDMTTETTLCKGLVERIGLAGSNLVHEAAGKPEFKIVSDMPNHTIALKAVIEALENKEHGVVKNVTEIKAVGHRIVHAAEDFSDSVLITPQVMQIFEKNKGLAPLHMPANIACVKSCMEVMPKTPMVAVFDTAFHMTMPKHAYMYAIPYEDYEKYKIRKYGFHGTSHKFVSAEAIKYLGKEKSRIITCHLGNGASMSAVLDGKSIDTTMGLTPLEGLIMGTRSGDLDPAVVDFMAASKGISSAEVVNILNKKSGLFGIAGVSDCRDLCKMAAEGNEKACLAQEMFAYRIKKYIGSYFAALGGLDAVIFTGGIGENSVPMRKLIMQNMEQFGIDFDFEFNEIAPRKQIVELTKKNSKVKVIIIPTNEELVIARDASRLTQ